MHALPLSQPWPVQPLPARRPLELCGWSVPAGFPSPAADHSQNRIDLNEHLVPHPEATFLFRVKGDSMTGAGIFEGDTLVVDRSLQARHNDVVLAVLHNEFTVKRLDRQGDRVRLVADNPLYPPRVIRPDEELTVWGVVTHSLHRLR